jgi:hypothetical protein
MTRMTPAEAAEQLREELEAALADFLGEAPPARVYVVHPPPDLGADRAFRIVLDRGDGRRVEASLPAGLAIAYLADEEAAVDEWRTWVRTTWQILRGASPPDRD